MAVLDHVVQKRRLDFGFASAVSFDVLGDSPGVGALVFGGQQTQQRFAPGCVYC